MCILNFCPKCKSFSKMPIVYGYPSKSTLQKARNGEIALGGCIKRDSNPKWQCKKCGYIWGGKPRDISANKNTVRSIRGSFISNHSQDKRKQKARQTKWEAIGSWETYQGSSPIYQGYIPQWIKDNLFKYLEQIGRENLSKIKDTKKREQLILESRAFWGTKYVRDKNFLYKLAFSESDETNYGDIYRKRRFFRGAKNVRRKPKAKA